MEKSIAIKKLKDAHLMFMAILSIKWGFATLARFPIGIRDNWYYVT
jgi:hypothetical protein